MANESGAVAQFPVERLVDLGQVATDAIATDTYANIPARLGMGTPNLLEASTFPLVRLTEDYALILSLYRGSWIVRRVVEVVPDDMLKSFPELDTDMDPELLKRFDKIVRRTGTLGKLRTTAKWGRLFGGAGAIIVIAGHDDLSQPLDLDDIEPGAYKGLIPLDRWSGIIPGPELVDDIEDTVNFGLPRYYNCIMDAGNTRIHHSRILRFAGRELPQWERQVELYWGLSEVEVIYDELRKRDFSSWNIVSLLGRAQVLSVEEPQLATLMSGAGGTNEAYTRFVERMEMISRLLNNQGLMVLGKDGKLNQNSYSFGGIADTYHEFMKDLSAACQIPYEVIFGRESGLGSNGESGLQLYYDMIEQKRTTELNPQMDKLIPIIAMSAFGDLPDELDYHWQPVRTMTEREKAELAKSFADCIAGYYNADLMTKKEARMEIQQAAPATGVGTNLTDEAVEATPDKYASELGGGEMDGGMGGMMPGMEGSPGEPGGGGKPGEAGPPGGPGGAKPKVPGQPAKQLAAPGAGRPGAAPAPGGRGDEGEDDAEGRHTPPDDNPYSRTNFVPGSHRQAMTEPVARQHAVPIAREFRAMGRDCASCESGDCAIHRR